ncbi:MAG TPA: protein kinase [Bryobacteraceae bacterium]|nr:protein kinase [Bryobacteraceae bacterium]
MDRIGRYKIVRELGRGAMGVVYHAIDPNIGRPVAIKTIQLGSVRNSDEQQRLRERLFREARSAGILSHPGIVTIYDVEQQDDVAYIAMEYVDGPTLDSLLSGPQPLAPGQMFRILAQTATALDYAHQKGIVHRDIKPANIMIAADGTAKIADFGIAKITASEQFTMTGSIVGTPHYMSPEQVQGQAVDGRSDQFSLAVIAYEMLTGEKPYTGEHLTTVVYKIVAEDPAPPHRLNATLSASIENVLRQGLAKKPEQRFRNCSEFVDSLEKACAATKGWKAMTRGGGLNEPTLGQIPPRPGAVTLPPSRRPRRADETATGETVVRKKSNFLPFLLAILMAAALLALIGWQAGPWTGSSEPNSPSKPLAKTQPPQAASKTQPAGSDKPHPMPPAQTTAKPAGDQSAPPSETVPAQPPSGSAAATPPENAPEKAPEKADSTPPETAPEKASEKAPEKSAPKVAANHPPAPPNTNATRTRPVSRPSAPTPQPVAIISSPGGATATLDGRSDTACTTPCSLDATPGRHTVAITMPGYQIEHREVNVGTAPLELPAVLLRAPSGTLMLTSVPIGAAIEVNGKKQTQVTPAELHLPPGSYRITVEKDGLTYTAPIDIRNGETKLMKLTLQQ